MLPWEGAENLEACILLSYLAYSPGVGLQEVYIPASRILGVAGNPGNRLVPGDIAVPEEGVHIPEGAVPWPVQGADRVDSPVVQEGIRDEGTRNPRDRGCSPRIHRSHKDQT